MNRIRGLSLFALLVTLLVVWQINSVVYADKPTVKTPDQSVAGSSMAALAEAKQVPVHFKDAVPYDSGGRYVNSVAVGDVNGDGKLDLIVANGFESGDAGSVGVLLGNGDGTFQTSVTYASGGDGALSVAAADVNGDGKLDLLVSNQWQLGQENAGGVGVLLGNGDGTFQPAVIYNTGGQDASAIAVGDVNGDGKLDLVIANLCATSNSSCFHEPGIVGVLLGKGDGTFEAPVSYSSGGAESASVAIKDLNGDGKPDLVVANVCQDTSCDGEGGVSVLLNKGDGTFKQVVTYDSGGGVSTLSAMVAIGDLNDDGRPDVAIANWQTNSTGSVNVLLNNGDGTLQTAVAYSSGGYFAASVAIEDVNGDGKADLVVANRCKSVQCQYGKPGPGAVSVLAGNGDGSFQSPVIYKSSGYDANAVTVADINMDGKPDLLVATDCGVNLKSGFCPSDGIVGVLINNFTANTATTVASSLNPSSVNQSVIFTATVTSVSSVPDGSTVVFSNGKTSLGSGTTTNGVAVLTTSFSKAKSYVVKATYSGDVFHKSSSGTVKQVVKQ